MLLLIAHISKGVIIQYKIKIYFACIFKKNLCLDVSSETPAIFFIVIIIVMNIHNAQRLKRLLHGVLLFLTSISVPEVAALTNRAPTAQQESYKMAQAIFEVLEGRNDFNSIIESHRDAKPFTDVFEKYLQFETSPKCRMTVEISDWRLLTLHQWKHPGGKSLCECKQTDWLLIKHLLPEDLNICS